MHYVITSKFIQCSGPSYSGDSQQMPHSFVWPKIYAAATKNIFTSLFHQSPPPYSGHILAFRVALLGRCGGYCRKLVIGLRCFNMITQGPLQVNLHLLSYTSTKHFCFYISYSWGDSDSFALCPVCCKCSFKSNLTEY